MWFGAFFLKTQVSFSLSNKDNKTLSFQTKTNKPKLPALWGGCLLDLGNRVCFTMIIFFSPAAVSFGVSAQIGSGVVRGGPEARFHAGSTRVPPGFHGALKKSNAYKKASSFPKSNKQTKTPRPMEGGGVSRICGMGSVFFWKTRGFSHFSKKTKPTLSFQKDSNKQTSRPHGCVCVCVQDLGNGVCVFFVPFVSSSHFSKTK